MFIVHATGRIHDNGTTRIRLVWFHIRPSGLENNQDIFILLNELAYCKIVLWN
jgi:hypothetical protein